MVHWVIIIIITIMLRSTCVLSIDDDETYPYILIDDSSFRKNDFYPHQQANQLYGVDDNGGGRRDWLDPTLPTEQLSCDLIDISCNIKRAIEAALASESIFTLLAYFGVLLTCIIAIFSIRDHYGNRDCCPLNRRFVALD